MSGSGEGVKQRLAEPGGGRSPVATVGSPWWDAVDVDLRLDTENRLVLALLHLDVRSPPDFRLLPSAGAEAARLYDPVRLERRLADLHASSPRASSTGSPGSRHAAVGGTHESP